MESNMTGLPPGKKIEFAPQPMPDEPESFLSRLGKVKLRGWMVIGPADYHNHTFHALLESSRGAHTVHVVHNRASGVLRLSVRLDEICPQLVRVNTVSRVMAGIPLVRITLDFELRAAFVEAATVAFEDSDAKRVLQNVVEPLRAVLSDRDLYDALGI